ncbi:MAG: peptidase [Chloroflexi bacterium]|nr:peptidase [Chloroflexota bacterium]
MAEAGYYRYPTLHDDTVVFVSEDDLWTAPATGGIARRLTSNLGLASTPVLSPDGAHLAFSGRDEGAPEVYCMPAMGGDARRLTFLGANLWIAGWSRDSQSILFSSSAGQPFQRLVQLFKIGYHGGQPEQLPTGPAMSISYGPGGGAVIGRNQTDLARWKRYRGGQTGDLWIDAQGSGAWQRLIHLPGNVASPRWVGERIYFVSDHEGIGNLYSCLPDGGDLRRHTHHDQFYTRHPATDGRRIVYHCGADLYLFDPAGDTSRMIEIEYHSPRVQRKRKFVEASRYLQSYDLHPAGHSVAIIARGNPFSLGNWEGPVIQYGEPSRVRYRLAAWLYDGKQLAIIGDGAGEEALEVHHANGASPFYRLEGLDIGRANALAASPTANQVALSNQRNELILVDLESRTARILDRSRYGNISGLAWSPDGHWIAYGFSDTMQTSIIKLCRVETGTTIAVTKAVLRDVAPAFDPEGKYLYFLSYRDFDPVYDNLHFDLNFPRGMRPFLVTLRADLPSPFIPLPRAPGEKSAKPAEEGAKDSEVEEKDSDKSLHIDLEGITERILAFPVDEGRYGQIRGMKGKALFTSYPVEGALTSRRTENTPGAKGSLEFYDFEEQNHDTLLEGITNFDVTVDGKYLIYRSGNRLRVLKAGEKAESNSGASGRKSGWLDLNRIRISVDPHSEWEQMYGEAWRLQRDQFWTADMSGVDWQEIYRRYLPVLQRVNTRTEFSDLMWEMQGELGTSHAYEYGGDYRPEPDYDQGFLGADYRYDPADGTYYLTRIISGDVWNTSASSPLCQPGIQAQPGDRLLAINGRHVGANLSPQELLVNQADNEILVTLLHTPTEELRTFSVRTLSSETAARYREWVEDNRKHVHEVTGGRAGYVHIPDMGAKGYAEFHRGYLAEVEREALIVDVRYNSGGHVSQLLLEKLNRRRLGYDISRWGQPTPYPVESVWGPMVALTNELAGSDGDMFSHAFKLMHLGPLIGTRTWGGVIGINVRDMLVDGSITTQPEYSFWFEDVGWGVENHGTEPDITVEIRPQDYVAGVDTQLERGIAEILRLLAEKPPTLPDFGNRPRLGLPKLP